MDQNDNIRNNKLWVITKHVGKDSIMYFAQLNVIRPNGKALIIKARIGDTLEQVKAQLPDEVYPTSQGFRDDPRLVEVLVDPTEHIHWLKADGGHLKSHLYLAVDAITSRFPICGRKIDVRGYSVKFCSDVDRYDHEICMACQAEYDACRLHPRKQVLLIEQVCNDKTPLPPTYEEKEELRKVEERQELEAKSAEFWRSLTDDLGFTTHPRRDDIYARLQEVVTFKVGEVIPDTPYELRPLLIQAALRAVATVLPLIPAEEV